MLFLQFDAQKGGKVLEKGQLLTTSGPGNPQDTMATGSENPMA
jgi:hypothetical protein